MRLSEFRLRAFLGFCHQISNIRQIRNKIPPLPIWILFYCVRTQVTLSTVHIIFFLCILFTIVYYFISFHTVSSKSYMHSSFYICNRKVLIYKLYFSFLYISCFAFLFLIRLERRHRFLNISIPILIFHNRILSMYLKMRKQEFLISNLLFCSNSVHKTDS